MDRLPKPAGASQRRAEIGSAVAVAGSGGHIGTMSTDAIYPYTLEIRPCEEPEGHFTWVIRERGKLLQRSDKPHSSEALARKRGEAEIERLLGPGR